MTTRLSAPGDSGSLILSADGLHPTALLYAGSSTETVGNPIQDVIKAFTATGKSFGFVGANRSCNTKNFLCPSTAASAGGTVRGHQGPSATEIDIARRIKEAHEPELFARPGILGVGVGAADEDPTRAVIVIYVDNGGGVALSHGLPSEIDGVRVKVIPTDPFVAF